MELQYLVREPQNITPETPILFMLHGYGSNEEDLFNFVPTLPEDWLVVSFRAPKNSNYGGYAWFDIDFNNPSNFLDENEGNEAVKLVMENIMSVTNRYGLTNNPTHLCGFSQGGIIVYSLALQYPDLFSKIACLSSFPEEKMLRNIVKDKKKYENLRFFISHGMEDAVIPIDWGRKAAEILYDLSAYFSFREYMSGHGVNQKNYLDLMEFFKK
ncbi:MAG: phospholipase [Chryseobacterium sp. 36-9]|uniref:Phospholipase/carboxylesterase n=1 Tax=Epilithonimonas pallida TaxID=373671 RepID=A0ABY1R865_9FLAO|nr:alpha/beta hydrolase-fold protein [Epilithonimonas pallida]OJX28718.1 MAG: phospholipase [Chryseobacterium sp. 36-9]SMP96776.1 phospholipase/carboxylesterase [Epilithonimonas pallida]